MRYLLVKSVWVFVLSLAFSSLGWSAFADSTQGWLASTVTQGGPVFGSCDVVASGRSLCHSECEVQSRLCQRQCKGDDSCMAGCTQERSVACCQKACDEKYSAAACALDKPNYDCAQPTAAQSEGVPPYSQAT